MRVRAPETAGTRGSENRSTWNGCLWVDPEGMLGAAGSTWNTPLRAYQRIQALVKPVPRGTLLPLSPEDQPKRSFHAEPSSRFFNIRDHQLEPAFHVEPAWVAASSIRLGGGRLFPVESLSCGLVAEVSGAGGGRSTWNGYSQLEERGVLIPCGSLFHVERMFCDPIRSSIYFERFGSTWNRSPLRSSDQTRDTPRSTWNGCSWIRFRGIFSHSGSPFHVERLF